MTNLKSLFNTEDFAIIAILSTVFTTWITTGDIVVTELASIVAMVLLGFVVCIQIFIKNIFNINLKLSFNPITTIIFAIVCTIYIGSMISPQCHATSTQSLEPVLTPYQAPAIEVSHTEYTIDTQNIHCYTYKDINGYTYHYEMMQPIADKNAIITLQFDPEYPDYTQDLYIIPLNQYTTTQLQNAPQYTIEILQEYQYTLQCINGIQ